MDKKLHFEAGRTAAIVAYFMATMVIIGRILGSHGHRSFRIELSRIPIVSIVCLGSAYVLSFLLAVGKEYLDTMSRGSLDALDIFATLDGTVCLLVPMIGVIVLCYLLTPIDRLILRLAVDRGGFGY